MLDVVKLYLWQHRAMARKDPQINIRIPADLKVSLESAALEGGRSVTAEIITRLQASFKAPMDLKREQLLLFINEVIDERLELTAQQSSPASQAVDVLVRGKKTTVNIPAFEGHVEPEAPVRKKIVLVRGKGNPTPKGTPVNKVIVIGNLGRDPEMRYAPDAGNGAALPPKPPSKKGPAKRTRNRPPK